MKLIENWQKQNLTCNMCGKTKSVKYEGKDKKCYCNKCIVAAEVLKELQGVFVFGK